MTDAENRAGLLLRSKSGTSDWLELANWLESLSQQIRSVVSEVAETFRLTDRQAMILWLCATDPHGMAQNELAKRLTLSPAQTCHLLDQLRERKLLRSSRDPDDRRRQRACLTEQGLQSWTELESALRERFAAFADEVSPSSPSIKEAA